MSCDAVASGGGEPPKLESQRSIPTPFLTKTYQIVDDPTLNDLISWTEDGTAFVVWQPAEFSRDLLPKYFKHNNFSSFVRQLNTYGFRKVAPDRWEFANDCFRRGEKSRLGDIHRRKFSISSPAPAAATAVNSQSMAVAVAIQISQADSGDEQALSSNSSPAVPAGPLPPEILEENDRLKKENSRLKLELNRLKTLCGSIYTLMSSYAVNPAESMPEILPETRSEEEEMCPRIFGVPIGDKRLKICGNGEGDDRETRVLGVVKSEPLDVGSSDGHDVGKV